MKKQKKNKIQLQNFQLEKKIKEATQDLNSFSAEIEEEKIRPAGGHFNRISMLMSWVGHLIAFPPLNRLPFPLISSPFSN